MQRWCCGDYVMEGSAESDEDYFSVFLALKTMSVES